MLNHYGDNFPFDFYFSRQALDRFKLKGVITSLESHETPNDTTRARAIIEHLHRLSDQPEEINHIGAAELSGIALIYSIYRFVCHNYITDNCAGIFKETIEKENHDPQHILTALGEKFPPMEVYLDRISFHDYLSTEKEGMPAEEIQFEKLLHIFLANRNPAFKHYRFLFDEAELTGSINVSERANELCDSLTSFEKIGENNNPLCDFLREPVIASPHSIPGQIEYIFSHWADMLPDYLLMRILRTLDNIREEYISRGMPGGPAETFVPDYDDSDLFPEYEAFSEDKDWMPKVVLLAKSTYVWLYQLSRTHGKKIQRLDEIPDEEIDRIGRWGFTGLWLIGLWERSRASARIKQICGNPEALSSAYSLYDYEIAEDLGGYAAYENLRNRCAARGIRLAADMVPNHMGIYSDWTQNHPEYFLKLDYSPYPSYNFNGENLSDDPGVGIYIEDGYYSKTEAAVVFKRVDHGSGHTDFIYHGNDGTSMPWNDTAQIDFLNPAAREAVIQKILHVARMFPVIRFDAAMTLAKKHIQRLWYPEPGHGGAIPSRSDHSLSRDDFHNAMPVEFWREVVDRIAQEAPDTLLLAEAFWLMEGYFVRTLGMHRVYNSAFMNMLKKEENHKFRNLIRETLEFNPEILKRYVNFMSNPDEETAVEQFGKGDKYFGVSTLMVTLPGLPMWAHGQIEGFTEKYGMEYGRAYYDEYPDNWLIERHEREIFPLMKQRYLFSGVDNFALYDFITPSGSVDENVFAYSNANRSEKAVILYNNRYGDTQGYIKDSLKVNLSKQTDNPDIKSRSLVDWLGLSVSDKRFVIFRDHKNGLEYIRSLSDLQKNGLFAMLGAYQIHVFINFKEVEEDAYGNWRAICDKLAGSGVESVEQAYHDLRLKPLLTPLAEILNKELAASIIDHVRNLISEKESVKRKSIEALVEKAGLEKALENFRKMLSEFMQISTDKSAVRTVAEEIITDIENFSSLMNISDTGILDKETLKKISTDMPSKFSEYPYEFWRIIIMYILIRHLGRLSGKRGYAQRISFWFDDWHLRAMLARRLNGLGASSEESIWEANLIRVLLPHQKWMRVTGIVTSSSLARYLFTDVRVREFLGVHTYDNTVWFHRESLEQFAYWHLISAFIHLRGHNDEKAQISTHIKLAMKKLNQLESNAEAAGYSLSKFFNLLETADKKKPTGRAKAKSDRKSSSASKKKT